MIHLSSTAIAEVNRLKQSRDQPDAWLRISVQPGGCQDLYYILDLVDRPHADDHVSQHDHIWVAVDVESAAVLEGMTVDYAEDLMGGGFRFRNPQSRQDCGCGNSFSTQAPEPTGHTF
ncbi:MAG: iron-sulfur cluster assembly accessory protein [Leptolyngbya sp. DLM2.Bin15]|nr:MAG: iron-sulfur cluster assembly accessory protein [Leptolyngbya sp. DLM2.Bin15]